jgi:hypothetical protein
MPVEDLIAFSPSPLTKPLLKFPERKDKKVATNLFLDIMRCIRVFWHFCW